MPHKAVNYGAALGTPKWIGSLRGKRREQRHRDYESDTGRNLKTVPHCFALLAAARAAAIFASASPLACGAIAPDRATLAIPAMIAAMTGQ
jgi:hypothetical protein